MRGATTGNDVLPIVFPISIHAPLARCDAACFSRALQSLHFNPRTSCEVRRPASAAVSSISTPFQSTHLLRGATVPRPICAGSAHYFNPRTSCEVRPCPARLVLYALCISIHAPLARCDRIRPFGNVTLDPFQSTHLLRGATLLVASPVACIRISIHAPLARCDLRGQRGQSDQKHFNPRTSCEVRPSTLIYSLATGIFQSTHLLRGATKASAEGLFNFLIFQSTHLLRGATKASFLYVLLPVISIHAPLARCDIRLG